MSKRLVKGLVISSFLIFSYSFFNGPIAAEPEQEKASPVAIGFTESVIPLISGESKHLSVISENDSSAQQQDETKYECQYAWGNEEVVRILPGCNVTAQHIGRVGLLVRPLKALAESQTSRELEIQVKPKIIGRYVHGSSLSLQVESHLHQQWFLINGFESSKIYRADFTGELVPGTRLRIITDNGRAGNSCGNTVPETLSHLTCYFGANRDAILLAIDRKGSMPFNVSMVFRPVIDSLIRANFNNTDPIAKNLTIGESVSGFVLANEIGSNSKHYFYFPVDQKEEDTRIQVRLFDFDEDIQLNVMWIDGYCIQDMIKKTPGQVLCRLPAKFMGDVTIVVDGNNGGSGLFNGPAIKSGGSFYRLVAEYVP